MGAFLLPEISRNASSSVGASLLAKDANTPLVFRHYASALSTFASKLAPTGHVSDFRA
ncbi:hypothetical protein SAMN05216205_4855 [Pseudomonas mohnii]|uniref:Uncharacterized protein n=1 Tax=Pseudomonas mohnii TaxID=395600 RepID=A0ABY0YBY0_9PSED|nr:hypothetical protein SAMN05216205_4855 [Pseudomonas mohnii]